MRADHLSLYGYEGPTTPRLDQWAQQARVYENAVSAASTTLPSHASMFTGLLPSEHGTHSSYQHLEDRFQTLAETLGAHGYQTYLWAANPYVSAEKNLAQGFEVVEHPWSPKYRKQASKIVRAKLRRDEGTSELNEKFESRQITPWMIKAAGELAEQGVQEFLDARDPARPWFLFLNYMEAHRPFIPSAEHRKALMTPEQVSRSYQVDRSWNAMWSYAFGFREYSDEELALMEATYDATLRELDDLFANLLEGLDSRGHLDNTVIVLASDHGELLGEHHLMDHQFSLYSPLTHVVLVASGPGLEPGRSRQPVMTLDVFPTFLDLAGIPRPDSLNGSPNLLDATETRPRLSEYSAVFAQPLLTVQELHPEFDPTPWQRRLRAYHRDPFKLIEGEDGRLELFALDEDPLETKDLSSQQTELVKELHEELRRFVVGLDPHVPQADVPESSAEMTEMLEGLGYVSADPATSAGSLSGTSSWAITDAKAKEKAASR